MARCDLPLYKNVLPKIRVTQITSNQIEKLKKMDPNKKAFFMNERVYANDEEKDVMEALAYVFSPRLKAKTNLGINMETFTNETYTNGLKALQKEGVDTADARELGEEIYMRVQKGQPLSNEARAIAIPAMLQRINSLPLLTKQYLNAYESGDQLLMGTFGTELAKSLAVMAGAKGDVNALSVGFNMYKYAYKQNQANAKILRLFNNGAC